MKQIIEKYSKKAYRVSGEINIPQARNTFFDEPVIQLNQNLLDPYGCGYMASIGALADLLGMSKSSASIIASQANKQKEDYGYQEGVGMYAYRAIDLVRDVANKELKIKTTSLMLEMGTNKMYTMLGKGYSIMVGYNGNKKYNEDKNDGLLEGVEFGPATYGHMVRLVQYKGDNYIIDNYNSVELDKIDIEEYAKQNRNIYKVKNLQALINNDVFFNYGFLFFIKDDMTKQEQNIKDVKRAYELGITDNEQNIRDVKDGNYTQSVQTVLMVMRGLKLQGDIEDLEPLN